MKNFFAKKKGYQCWCLGVRALPNSHFLQEAAGLGIVETFKTILVLRMVEAANSKLSWGWKRRNCKFEINLGLGIEDSFKTILRQWILKIVRSILGLEMVEVVYLETVISKHIKDKPKNGQKTKTDPALCKGSRQKTSSQKLGRHASPRVHSVWKSLCRVSFILKKFGPKIFSLIFSLNWIILRKLFFYLQNIIS